MIKKDTEKRLYCLVPYNLSDIQKGIQCGHCIAEYSNNIDLSCEERNLYVDWARNWKTIIILNGGTTNNNKDDKWYGSLQKHRDKLKELGVVFSEFHEPDLNNALTAVSFIVDMEKDWMILKYLENLELA